jgi:rSAM/selenodomain-associated transferase 1
VSAGADDPVAQVRRHVIVFARVPRLGEVKSRLAATLGAEAALEAHRELLAATLATVGACPAVERWLCLAGGQHGPGAETDLAPAGFRLSWQSEGDLGARMAHALRASVARGVPAVLVGCDCPPLDVRMLEAAFEALEHVDIVFGPTEDGGYALVGVRRDLPMAFADIAWGSSRVMAQTRDRLVRAGVTWRELPALWDVDDEADWKRWQRWRGAGHSDG